MNRPRPWRSRPPRIYRGFSLIEMIVVLLITAILMSLGLPALRDTLMRNTLVTASNELTFALARARSESLRLNRTLYLCPTNQAGAPDCAVDSKSLLAYRTGELAATYAKPWYGWAITDSDRTTILQEGSFPSSRNVSVCGPTIRITATGILAGVPDITTADGNGTYLFPSLYVESQQQCRQLDIFAAGKIRATLNEGACSIPAFRREEDPHTGNVKLIPSTNTLKCFQQL